MIETYRNAIGCACNLAFIYTVRYILYKKTEKIHQKGAHTHIHAHIYTWILSLPCWKHRCPSVLFLYLNDWILLISSSDLRFNSLPYQSTLIGSQMLYKNTWLRASAGRPKHTSLHLPLLYISILISFTVYSLSTYYCLQCIFFRCHSFIRAVSFSISVLHNRTPPETLAETIKAAWQTYSGSQTFWSCFTRVFNSKISNFSRAAAPSSAGFRSCSDPRVGSLHKREKTSH